MMPVPKVITRKKAQEMKKQVKEIVSKTFRGHLCDLIVAHIREEEKNMVNRFFD
jgi:23S rRNA maturation mini-RNase III